MTTIHSVPVIDGSRLSHPSTLRDIDRACREWGFFQVVGHGIDAGLIARLKREMHAFFALPVRTKRSVERSADNPWGFFDRELTKNEVDQKEIFDCGGGDDPEHPTHWPAASPGFRPAVEDYMNACEGLAFRLLAAISRNLGMPEDHLAADFRPRHTSFLRLNYYPVCSPGDGAEESGFGVGHHTDSGALTLLLQDDEPGLEVHREGRWHLVEPRSDALVINLGDIVQVWSNDLYRAALHRVRASRGRPRYSVPFFFNPSYESVYAPLRTTIEAGLPARYRPIHWREFRTLRAAGDYQDCGEEVQIERYRVGVERATNHHSVIHHAEEQSHGIH